MILIVITIDNSYKVLFSNQNETRCNVQPPSDENTYIIYKSEPSRGDM